MMDNRNGMSFPRDHVVLVTGGGTGIGAAIARAFDAAGATVCITGRTEESLESALDTMSDRARSLAFDVTELDRLPARIQEIEQMCGPVRTLINNAGRHQKKPSLDVADEEFLSVINTNLLATFGLAREVARRLISLKQSGDIQFISSMSALFGLPMVAAYTASKTAICGLVRQLPAEWSELGIRVNGIAPGFIETAMSRKIFDADPAREAKIIDRTPMRRLGTPDEIAGLSLFLASPLASFITGTTIPVDGGASIGF